MTKTKRTPWQRQDDANRVALIMLGVQILGHALITRHDRQHFTVHELSGRMFTVVERDGELRCRTCPGGTGNDEHAALILLYVLRLENRSPRGVK